MRSRLAVSVLAASVFCLLLVLAPSPSAAQCGPGGAGCGGGCSPYGEYCDGVACAVPGDPTLNPGYCTPAQEAAGGYEVFGAGQCGNDGAGGCVCYLPQHVYEITRDCYIRFPPSLAEVSLGSMLQDALSGACVSPIGAGVGAANVGP